MKAFASVLVLLVFTSTAFSAQVLKVKGKGVLIDTAGENFKPGQIYYLVDFGSKKGIVGIVKVAPGKAIGKVLKGKAAPNWTLQLRKKGSSGSKTAAPSPSYKTPKAAHTSSSSNNTFLKDVSIGASVGYSSNSASVKFTEPTAESSQSGSSIQFEGFLTYALTKKFSAKASLGMQSYNSEDTSDQKCLDESNNLTNPCTIALSYANIDFWAQYYFLLGKFSLWGGAGIGVLIPLNFGDTTSLDENDFTTTSVIQLGGGIDYDLDGKFYVPLQLQYDLYPSSDTVTLNSFSGYVGIGYRF